MKLVAIVLSLLFSWSALALQPTSSKEDSNSKPSEESQQRTELQFYPIGLESRYERGSSQDLESRQTWNFSLAYRTQVLSALLEYSSFSEDSGSATSNISRLHKEAMLWGRWHFVRFEYSQIRFSVYAGLGIGTYQEEIKTTLMSDSTTEQSGYKVVSGGALGADASVNLTERFGLVAALETRALFSGEFDPNPTGDGVLRIGILWNLN